MDVGAILSGAKYQELIQLGKIHASITDVLLRSLTLDARNSTTAEGQIPQPLYFLDDQPSHMQPLIHVADSKLNTEVKKLGPMQNSRDKEIPRCSL